MLVCVCVCVCVCGCVGGGVFVCLCVCECVCVCPVVFYVAVCLSCCRSFEDAAESLFPYPGCLWQGFVPTMQLSCNSGL